MLSQLPRRTVIRAYSRKTSAQILEQLKADGIPRSVRRAAIWVGSNDYRLDERYDLAASLDVIAEIERFAGVPSILIAPVVSWYDVPGGSPGCTDDATSIHRLRSCMAFRKALADRYGRRAFDPMTDFGSSAQEFVTVCGERFGVLSRQFFSDGSHPRTLRAKYAVYRYVKKALKSATAPGAR